MVERIVRRFRLGSSSSPPVEEGIEQLGPYLRTMRGRGFVEIENHRGAIARVEVGADGLTGDATGTPAEVEHALRQLLLA